MNETELLYLNDCSLVICTANVLDIMAENDRVIITLDKTVFYPQGGGQPWDTGIILSQSAEFITEEVRISETMVRHIGKFQYGKFNVNDHVRCLVDENRRMINNRLHSAGHVLDMAVKELHLDWVPGKGYHFPNGPYVEYEGTLANLDKEKLKSDLEARCNSYIEQAIPTRVSFVTKEELNQYCDYIPDYLSDNKPVRLISFADSAVPCGGTHVQNLSEIGSILIRKIKAERNKVKVSYSVIE